MAFKKGQIPWIKGRKHTEEAKMKNREAHLGKKLTKEHREKISQAGLGREVSKETRKKISKAHKGKKLSMEHRANLIKSHMGQNAWNKGKKMTKEYCERMKGPKINCRQNKAYQWSGGRKNRGGYIAIISPDCKLGDRARYILEHRLVAEKAINRKLKKGEIVHHINGNIRDNQNSNLLICLIPYHRWFHGKMAQLYMKEHFVG